MEDLGTAVFCDAGSGNTKLAWLGGARSGADSPAWNARPEKQGRNVSVRFLMGAALLSWRNGSADYGPHCNFFNIGE